VREALTQIEEPFADAPRPSNDDLLRLADQAGKALTYRRP